MLIPARNEERSIRAAIESVLSSRDVALELIVLDDHSEDQTSRIIRETMHDPRMRLEFASELPAGWCGKQFACFSLARLASHDYLIFLDADVRLSPSGVSKMVAFLESSQADLVSGFPHQEVGSFHERLLLPLMHFFLLSFLPMDLMRKGSESVAGCGLWTSVPRTPVCLLARRGTCSHSRIAPRWRFSLSRAFRKAGFRTSLCDATSVAECRMYANGPEVFRGLLKNATEGVAAFPRIFVFTTLLLLGHVLPFMLLIVDIFSPHYGITVILALLGAVLSLAPRVAAAMPIPAADDYRDFASLGHSGVPGLAMVRLCAIADRHARNLEGPELPAHVAARICPPWSECKTAVQLEHTRTSGICEAAEVGIQYVLRKRCETRVIQSMECIQA